MIKIDKGRPIPSESGGGRPYIYPWREMKPGDSFFAAGVFSPSGKAKAAAGKGFNTKRGTIAIPGSKWATRTVTEKGVAGTRVWRVE